MYRHSTIKLSRLGLNFPSTNLMSEFLKVAAKNIRDPSL